MSNSPNHQQWHRQHEKGSFLGFRLMLAFYRYGGRSVFNFILAIVIWWYWLFVPQARKNSLDYLTRLHNAAQENSPFSSTPTVWHSYLHLRSFGESILDKMAGWLGDIPEQDLKLSGHEYFQQYYQKGAILLVSHFGNIELLRAIKSDHIQTVNVLVYRKHAEKFNRFLQGINPKAAVRLISVDEMGIDTAVLLQERLDAGEWIVIAADRTPIHSNRQQMISFLGEHAAWPEGAWLIAHLLQAPVMAVFCYPYQQQIQVHIHLLSENLHLPRRDRQQVLAQYMQQYVILVEQHCMVAPYQWFNFYNFWGQVSCLKHQQS